MNSNQQLDEKINKIMESKDPKGGIELLRALPDDELTDSETIKLFILYKGLRLVRP